MDKIPGILFSVFLVYEANPTPKEIASCHNKNHEVSRHNKDKVFIFRDRSLFKCHGGGGGGGGV